MYKLNAEKMYFDMADGQAVVINFLTGVYYGSTSLGSVILERLVNGNDPEQISKAVQTLSGHPEDFDAQLSTFITKLRENEILVAGETVPGGDEPISSIALADGFDLKLDEFSEVQDLILADPVHDVDVEQGWPVFKEES
ncbi:MAG: PqqD family protein [Clostridia bacterium]|nr:PqqD family protein [Clostridia bacterium]